MSDKFFQVPLQVCSKGCEAASALCRPLTSFSIGAKPSETFPESSTDDCGVEFGTNALGPLATESPETTRCTDFYLISSTAGATLKDICDSSECYFRMKLDDGSTVMGSISDGGEPVTLPPETSDPPVTMPPETSDPPVTTTPPPMTTTTPPPFTTAAPTPTPYGRRRLTSLEKEIISASSGRTLQQYGRKR